MFGLLLIVGMLVGIWLIGYISFSILRGIADSIESWKKERIHNKKMKTDPEYKKKWEWDNSEAGQKEKLQHLKYMEMDRQQNIYDFNKEY